MNTSPAKTSPTILLVTSQIELSLAIVRSSCLFSNYRVLLSPSLLDAIELILSREYDFSCVVLDARLSVEDPIGAQYLQSVKKTNLAWLRSPTVLGLEELLTDAPMKKDLRTSLKAPPYTLEPPTISALVKLEATAMPRYS